MKKKRFIRYIAVILMLILISLITVYFVDKNGVNTLIYGKPKVTQQSPKITQLPANTTTNSGVKNPDVQTGNNQQTSTDQHGQAPNQSTNNPSTWLVSQSGVLTVKLPTSNTSFSDGDTLYGSLTSTDTSVQYRLTDDQVGVISQGVISVVNGNFTGIIHFKAYAKTGRLDVFTTDLSGKEYNEVQVPLTFN